MISVENETEKPMFVTFGSSLKALEVKKIKAMAKGGVLPVESIGVTAVVENVMQSGDLKMIPGKGDSSHKIELVGQSTLFGTSGPVYPKTFLNTKISELDTLQIVGEIRVVGYSAADQKFISNVLPITFTLKPSKEGPIAVDVETEKGSTDQ